ncbi:MAG: glycosyl transferase [Bacteroidetes bacterium]|nr:MAG: glycosyl transferase [Bacteroidota bacterium]
MISIITAIHNQLPMNKLFLHYLKKNTKNQYELIIIDNDSTDGSGEFFLENGVKVIKNEHNYSYPFCQNQGIKVAKYDTYIFLNNDVIVSKNWDAFVIEIIKKHKLDVCSVGTNEHKETDELTRISEHRWKAIKNPLLFLFGTGKLNLKLMFKLMYWNWDKYTENIYNNNKDLILTGINGPAVIITKKGLEKIGLWDERIQGADYDIYLRTLERLHQHNDIQEPKIIMGVYFHHYSRLSLKKAGFKKRKIVFKDYENLISVEEKWGKDYANNLLKGSGFIIR